MTNKTIREITEDITMDMINIQNGLLDKLLNAYKSVKEEKENLSMELNEYKNLGSLEELKKAKKYIDLARKHGTIGKVIEECAEYEAIGTVEECREAVDKTKAKKPDYEGDGYADGHMVYDTWICPNCGEKYEVDYDDYNHCPKCGQKIDWSDEK